MTNRWAVLALLFIVRSTMGFQFQSVPSVAPLLMESFAVQLADIGLLIGIHHAPGFALAIPGGGLGRRFGDKLVVAIGLMLMIAGALIMALSALWGFQLAGRLLAGAGAVLMNVLMSKMVTDWFAGREISTAMAVFVNSWPFGLAIGLVAIPTIATAGGLIAVQLSVAALICIGLIALLTLYRPPTQITVVPAGTRAWPQGTAAVALIIAAVVWGFYNAGFAVLFGFGPTMLTERGWPLALASSTTSIVLWLTVVSVPLGGLLADRTGRPISVLVGSCACLALLLALAARSEESLPIFVAIGLLGGWAAGPILSLQARVLAPETRALGTGLFYMIFYVMQSSGSWLAGEIATYTGSASSAFDIGAVFIAGSILATGAYLSVVSRAAAV